MRDPTPPVKRARGERRLGHRLRSAPTRDPQRGRSHRRRLGYLLALALTLGVVIAPASRADLGLAGTLFTPATVDASTRYVLYYLQMHSAASEELFSVQMTPPPFATAGGLAEGQSIDGPTAIALQGPGTLGDLVQRPSVIAACSSRESAFHGYASGPASVDILLPPNSATTLAVRYATGRRAPWVDSDFKLAFTVQTHLVGTYAAGSPFAAAPTVTSAVTMTTRGPLVGARTGAHILLTTSPQGAPGTPAAPRPIGSHQPVAISGRLLPARGGRRIVLQWARAGGALRTLTTVRTDARGRFTVHPWRPGGPGTYELWASYPAQPGGLLADTTSCPQRFTVR